MGWDIGGKNCATRVEVIDGKAAEGECRQGVRGQADVGERDGLTPKVRITDSPLLRKEQAHERSA